MRNLWIPLVEGIIASVAGSRGKTCQFLHAIRCPDQTTITRPIHHASGYEIKALCFESRSA